jgi:N-acetylglucosamine malate deacetylase 1
VRILVTAAHPDDEVLGAGGAIARSAAEGADVTILVAAEGVMLRHADVSLDMARDTCREAAAILGVHDVRFGGLCSDGVLLSDLNQRSVVGLIEHTIGEVYPDVVITHHPHDIHADHRCLAAAVTYATRIPSASGIRRIAHMEVLSSTEQQTSIAGDFRPNLFVDITSHVESKVRGLEVYRTELQGPYCPRSTRGVRTLAAYRGLRIGVAGAEAFEVGVMTSLEGRECAFW